jgi:hypothetical protein
MAGERRYSRDSNGMKSELTLIATIVLAVVFLGVLFYQSYKSRRKWTRKKQRRK